VKPKTITSTHPPGTVVVDGAEHPEGISDDAAIIAVMLTLDSSLATDRRVRDTPLSTVYLNRMGLGSKDSKLVGEECARLHMLLVTEQQHLREMEVAVANGTATIDDAPYGLLKRRNDLLFESYARLTETLSKKGAKQLRDYIQAQKRNMTALKRAP